MPRFDFQSPGVGFTESITDMLAQRKAEERQRMLDQLTVNADIRSQEAAARQERESKVQVAGWEQQQEIDRLNALTAGMTRGADVPDEHESLFNKWGRMGDFPGGQVSTDASFADESGSALEGQATEVAPPSAPRRGYLGSAVEQEKARKDAQTASTIATLLGSEDPRQRAKGEYLATLTGLFDGNVPEQAAARTLAPDVPYKKWSEATGTLSDLGYLPADTQIIEQSRPPQDLRPRNWLPVIGPPGPDGRPAGGYVDQDSIKPGPDGIFRLPEGYRPDRGSAGNQRDQPLGVSHSVVKAYRDEVGIIQQDPDTGVIEPGQMSALRGAAADIIQDSAASPRVKDLAMAFIRNPSGITTQELTPQEKTQFTQLLGLIAPDLTDVNRFQKNAIRPPQKKEEPKKQSAAPDAGASSRFMAGNAPQPSMGWRNLFTNFNQPYAPTQY